jgi:hypothetical protein
MADRNGKTNLVGKTLEFPFPQTQSRTIAASRICRDQQPFSLGVRALSFSPPPCPDRGNGKSRSIMICSNIDETLVARQLVNAIRMRSRNRRVWEIMTIDLPSFAFPDPLLAPIDIY